MTRDFMIGYPPAAGELFEHPPHWVHLGYALGVPRRVLDECDNALRAEPAPPLFAIDHRNQTAGDVRGAELRKVRMLVQLHEQAARLGLSVQCRQTWRAADGQDTATTHNVHAPAVR